MWRKIHATTPELRSPQRVGVLTRKEGKSDKEYIRLFYILDQLFIHANVIVIVHVLAYVNVCYCDPYKKQVSL